MRQQHSSNESKIRSDQAPQRCSMPCFLTLAFLILSGSHAGPPAGLSTIEIEPVKTCTRLVPRSRRRMFVCPRVAALRAAPRGCLLANTWLVSLPFSMRTKYFLSDIWITSKTQSEPIVIIYFAEKRQYCSTYSPQYPIPNPVFQQNGLLNGLKFGTSQSLCVNDSRDLTN